MIDTESEFSKKKKCCEPRRISDKKPGFDWFLLVICVYLTLVAGAVFHKCGGSDHFRHTFLTIDTVYVAQMETLRVESIKVDDNLWVSNTSAIEFVYDTVFVDVSITDTLFDTTIVYKTELKTYPVYIDTCFEMEIGEDVDWGWHIDSRRPGEPRR